MDLLLVFVDFEEFINVVRSAEQFNEILVMSNDQELKVLLFGTRLYDSANTYKQWMILTGRSIPSICLKRKKTYLLNTPNTHTKGERHPKAIDVDHILSEFQLFSTLH